MTDADDARDDLGSGLGVLLVGHDGSPGGAAAVAWASGLAARAGMRVVLVHAFEPLAEIGRTEPPLDFHALRTRREAELGGEWAAPLVAAGVEFEAQVIEGRPVEVLVDAAAAYGAGLVVIGSHGATGWRERLLGSVAVDLPHDLPCPLVLVPAPRRP